MPRALLSALQERGASPERVLLQEGCYGDLPGPWQAASTDAVALRVTDSLDALEKAVRAIARHQTAGSLLVLMVKQSDRRSLARGMGAAGGARQHPLEEALHLLLLRCGYEHVWPHGDGKPLCVSARRAPPPEGTRMCSIIVPVYNERETFPALMQQLLAKRLGSLGLAREIILVESNSTDGTREQVAAFADHAEVRVLWQERALGKGDAVRAGLAIARGDIVLIQDADLEYDVNDYDKLLAPLLRDEAAFVLGCRHGSRAGRMRELPEQPLLGQLLDLGHVGFTALINILYGQSMRDPFTMFKVFRRDCLYGLDFECQRFDFDHELLIKLLLKGYRPLEIPVSYRSRSFRQGKKIRPWPDALSWIVADLKYRVQPLRPRID
jgi:hypothetical protein